MSVDIAILLPVFALAGWTGLVLVLILVARVRGTQARQVRVEDFRYGESAQVPHAVSLPNRNYMNLLELPQLFYLVCVLLYVTAQATPWALGLAWAYVALRVLHSLIHLGDGPVLLRLAAFASSNVTLLVLWVQAGLRILGTPTD